MMEGEATTFESAAIGMALVGLDGSWIDVNTALTKIVGYGREELLRTTFQQITHPDDLDADLANVNALLSGEISSYEMEKRYIKKDRGVVWILLTVTLVRDGGGGPLHFIAQIQNIHERKFAERMLRESEERYRTIFEESQDGIFITDRLGRILECNAATRQITACTEEELLGHNRFDLLIDEQERNDAMKTLDRGGYIRDREVVIRRADGRQAHLLLTILPHKGEDGQVERFQGRLHDISARHEIVAIRGRLASVISSSADAIISGDMDGTITTWNRSAEQMFGFTAGEMIGRSVAHVGSLDPFEMNELLKMVRAGEDVIGFETVRRHKNGDRIHVSVTISPILDEKGRSFGYSMISRDIRGQKEAERTRRRSQEQLRTIVSAQEQVATAGLDRAEVAHMIAVQAQSLTRASGASVEIRDGEAMVAIAVSGALEDYLGYRIPVENSLSGMCSTTKKTMNCEDVENHPMVALAAAAAVDVRSIAIVPLSYSRNSAAVLKVVSPQRNAFGGESIQILELMAGMMAAAMRDAEAYELQKSLLTEREAYAGELERSNAALQDFASIASHDLQEPLRKVQAFGDRLASRYTDVLDEQGLDYLDRMRGAAARMRTLIEDLLSLSRVTSNAQPFQPVELGQVIAEVTDDLSAQVERSGATVRVGELPTIDADALQMRQLFQNLISNGMKFNREGVDALVEVSSNPVSNGFAELTVTDNGIGFETAHAEQIFKPFERLHARSSYPGTGIGLTICRKIVERHRGSITAHGRPGEGSTFVIRLPAKHPTPTAL